MSVVRAALFAVLLPFVAPSCDVPAGPEADCCACAWDMQCVGPGFSWYECVPDGYWGDNTFEVDDACLDRHCPAECAGHWFRDLDPM